MLAQAPALPLDEAGKYVAAAYLVFLALLLVYVAVMGARVARMERDLAELDDAVRRRRGDDAPSGDQEPERIST